MIKRIIQKHTLTLSRDLIPSLNQIHCAGGVIFSASMVLSPNIPSPLLGRGLG